MALTDNLEGYWKFDESSGNASDSTANGNTLTNNNTATYGPAVINNGAYLASASTQFFSKSDTASLSITGDLSISGWFYNTDSAVSGTFVSKWLDAGNQRGYIFDYDPASSGTLRLVLSTTGSDFPLVTVTGASLSSTTFYYLTMTFKASTSKVNFYKNASLVGAEQTISASSIFDNTADFTVGMDTGGKGYLNGRVDELGVWARVLTGAEITELYNGGAGLSYPFTPDSASPRRFDLKLLGVGQ